MASVGDVYDAIVVGSGATGGWAAKELGEAGLKVLVLEAGPLFEHFRKRTSTEPFETRYAVQSRSPLCSPHTRQLFVDDVDHPYTTPAEQPFTWIRGRIVGGRLRTWGRVCLRMSDLEFQAPVHDGIGEPWPLDYAELAPYYDEVEEMFQVTGTCEGLPQLPDGRFAAPICEDTQGFQRLRSVVREHFPELRLIPGRVALAESSVLIQRALATGNVTLRPDAIAARVLVTPDGHTARGIGFIDRVTRQPHEVFGRVIVLAASTIETTRLLLMSAPGGLGNSSGVLGRYLMDQVQVSSFGTMRDVAPRIDLQDLSGRCYIPRFTNLPGGPQAPFARGYGIDVNVQGCAFGMPGPPTFWLGTMGEMLPYADNQVTLDPQVTDVYGLPAPHIRCKHGENEAQMVKHQREVVRSIVEALGFELGVTSSELPVFPPGATVHEVGTARMGSSPTTSYLDRFNRSWDVPNMFVVDGSCFPTSGWQNSTLTMMALAVRASRHIVQELRRMNL